ncbi:poly(ethylene terephthalate) hydrolase family protein [Streptomyces mirabilis]|uniref:poly(ethylene terephthalate) hydrolase family protein n=1 Tax=Streptomyces mirabilis TaxID=68239 RepID=UPI0033ACA9A6
MGGGVISASERRPSLKAAIALAPYSSSQNPTTDRVPTMVIGGQNDTVVTPSHLDSLYVSMPAATQSAFLSPEPTTSTTPSSSARPWPIPPASRSITASSRTYRRPRRRPGTRVRCVRWMRAGVWT